MQIPGLCDAKMLRKIGRNPGELKSNFLKADQHFDTATILFGEC